MWRLRWASLVTFVCLVAVCFHLASGIIEALLWSVTTSGPWRGEKGKKFLWVCSRKGVEVITYGKIVKIIVKGADERPSEAHVTVGKAKDGSRMLWPCVHLLLQVPVMFLQWSCVCSRVLTGRMSVVTFLHVVSQRLNVVVCAGTEFHSHWYRSRTGLLGPPLFCVCCSWC